jgi:nitroimidazol reductase NimA-like FMN-containing flavoprotein (pyridoxamine 5'-phosphate oxidase superfamily)
MDRAGALNLLDEGRHGILAMADAAGRPYAVPLSYGREGDRIFFHCAETGQKLDVLRANAQAVFCVMDAGTVNPGEDPCSTSVTYRSVLVFGRVGEITAPSDKLAALDIICRHHGIPVPPAGTPGAAAYAKRAQHTVVLGMTMEHVSGKARS